MKKLYTIFAIFIFLALSCGPGRKPVTPSLDERTGPPPSFLNRDAELRGIWVTRFEWAHPSSDSVKQNIDGIMERVADLNFNAVFFQIRGQADALYPSRLETWSPLTSEEALDFDPVAYAVEKAREKGLLFYAYVNMLPLWNGTEPPKDQNHLFYKHGPHVGETKSWVCFNKSGEPMGRSEYYYLNPVHPGVRSHLRKVVTELCVNYDFDGIHFDRIRYPGPEFCYDSLSNELFAEDSAAYDGDRAAWCRDQLTDAVEELAAAALTVRPYLRISCAAWGIYRTDLPGYEKFSSGYDDYYQDAVGWVNDGIMDFMVPMTYWNIPDPKPNFDELFDYFSKKLDEPKRLFMGIRTRKEWIMSSEIQKQVDYVRDQNGFGNVVFSYSDVRSDSASEIFKKNIYREKTPAPEYLLAKRKTRPFLFKLNNYAWRFVKDEKSSPKRPDSEGYVGFIASPDEDSLSFVLDDREMTLDVNDYYPPYRFFFNENKEMSRETPLEIRFFPKDTVSGHVNSVLAVTDSSFNGNINGDSCHVYQTGVFFKKFDLKEGKNRYWVEAVSPDGEKVGYGDDFFSFPSRPRADFPLWIDSASVSPEYDMELLTKDQIDFSWKASKGQKGRLILGAKTWAARETSKGDYGFYQVTVPLKDYASGEVLTGKIVMASAKDEKNVKEYALPYRVKVFEGPVIEMVRAVEDVEVKYGMGRIRLGGPMRGIMNQGTVFPVTGKLGENYRVRLDETNMGFVKALACEKTEGPLKAPDYFINSIHCGGDSLGDVVSVPYYVNAPYQAFPEPEMKRIRFKIFGGKTNSTWIIHKNTAKYVKRVEWEQTAPTTYEVIVYLNTEKIWGYELKPEGSRLNLRIFDAPKLEIVNDSLSLEGIKIALEAGHGGTNLGAVSLSGITEKEINLKFTRLLEEKLKAMKVDVLQTRDADVNMWLSEKKKKAEDWGAEMYVSVHANASGINHNYLGADGTSIYYHNPWWSVFGRFVYKRLLELPLDEFGLVGSFNYRPIRMTQRPAILVEQAFMSNAEDEEKLASPEFRKEMVDQVYEGIIDYIEWFYEKPVKRIKTEKE